MIFEGVIQYFNLQLSKGLSNKTGNGAIWLFLGVSCRILIQALYFILLAHLLGASGYGLFSSIVALVTIIAPFSGLGSGHLLLQTVSRDKSMFKEQWGNAIFLLFVTGFGLSFILFFVSKLIFNEMIPSDFLIAVIIADLIFLKLVETGSLAFQAYQYLGWTAQLQVLCVFFRLIAVVLVSMYFKELPISIWGYVYLASTLAAGFLTYLLVTLKIGRPKVNLKVVFSQMKEKLAFSVGNTAENSYISADKVMVGSMSSLHAAGVYATSYRLIEVAFSPVLSIAMATYSNFFKSGGRGIGNTISYARKFFPIIALYTFVAACLIYCLAPIIPLVIGEEFKETVATVQWLAIIPFLRAMNMTLANILTGSGNQLLRAINVSVVVVTNIVLNTMLIPVYSWYGAVYSLIGTQTLLLLLLSGNIIYLLRMEKRALSSLLPGGNIVGKDNHF